MILHRCLEAIGFVILDIVIWDLLDETATR